MGKSRVTANLSKELRMIMLISYLVKYALLHIAVLDFLDPVSYTHLTLPTILLV